MRSQEAKKALPREFDGSLAMTVLESKGLECKSDSVSCACAERRSGVNADDCAPGSRRCLPVEFSIG